MKKICPLFGAIAGDIIGSVFEWHNVKSKEFELFSPKSRFTDDSVMTIATADALLHGLDYATAYQKWGNPEGIKGAQATALAIFLARNRADKNTIKQEMETRFQYDLSSRTLDGSVNQRFIYLTDRYDASMETDIQHADAAQPFLNGCPRTLSSVNQQKEG